MSQSYAVLIGVDHYPSLGSSARLRGAVHDAHHWLGVCRGHLGVPAERCELLTSGQRSHGDQGLPEGNVNEATLAQARHAIGRMAAWLKEQSGGTGILFFSGHGASVNTEHAVVPGDRLGLALQDATVDGGEVNGVLVLSRIEEMLMLQGVAERVTVIVDACYTTLQGEGFAPGLGRIGQEPHREGPRHGLSRILLGSGLWSPAYESHIDGQWRGVFSFALQTVLSQWKRAQQGDVTYIRGTYQEALFRTRSLLQALGYDEQQPQLSGSLRAPVVPFNFPTLEPTAADSSPVPDGNRRGKEVTGEGDKPGIWSFNLKNGNETYRDFLIAVNPTSGSSAGPLVITGGATDILVGPQQEAFLESANMEPHVTQGGTDTCDISYASVDPDGYEPVAYPYNVSGFSTELQEVYSGHQVNTDTWTRQDQPPTLGENPTFGPVTMDLVSTSGVSTVEVLIEFVIADDEVSAVKWWSLTTDANPPDSFTGDVAITGDVSANRVDPDDLPTGTWYLCNAEDDLTSPT